MCHVNTTREIFFLEHGLSAVLGDFRAVRAFNNFPQARNHALVRVAGVALVLQLKTASDVCDLIQLVEVGELGANLFQICAEYVYVYIQVWLRKRCEQEDGAQEMGCLA